MTSRRAFLSRLALLAAGGAGLWLVRDRLPWPPLEAQFADGRASAWMPLADREGLLEVDVAVNGNAVRAVIDSGAQVSAVDRELAEHLALRRNVTAPILAYGVSGAPALTHTVRMDLAMPGLAVPGLRAAVLDLGPILAMTGRDFRLLIGRDLLGQVVLEADFQRVRTRLVAQHAYSPPRDARLIPLRMRGGAPMVSVQVEGAEPIEVLVDTGATGLLALSETAATEAGLLAPGRRITRAHSVSLGGFSLDRMVTARSLRIGDLSVTRTPVQIYRPAAHASAPAGLLGAGLYRRFHLALDLAGGRLLLTPPTPLIVPRLSEQSSERGRWAA